MAETAVREGPGPPVEDHAEAVDSAVGATASGIGIVPVDSTVDAFIATEWMRNDRAALRALGYDPAMPQSEIHAMLSRSMASPGTFWVRGVADCTVVGYAWIENTVERESPVVSFLVAPQHRSRWARPFGMAAVRFAFDNFPVKRLMAKIPVEVTEKALRNLLHSYGGSVPAYYAQRWMGFQFAGCIPMVLERGDFDGV